jgi:O-methyltransferase involved in polyketide biosynthesis
MSGSEAISPTAHYTGEVWARNGLSHPWLSTPEGRAMFAALQPVMNASAAIGGPTLEAYLLARHRAIDVLLTRAIERDGLTQVLEIAAGMSPRGWRSGLRYGAEIDYWEADLPDMAQRKAAALRRIGALGEHHHVVELDALRRRGPRSLDELVRELDPARGLVVITEGLLGYLTTPGVLDLWERLAEALGAFPAGRYISDIHLGSVQSPIVRLFRVGLGAFVRGSVHLHFADAADAEARLRLSGFARARVRPADRIADLASGGGASLAHILEASTRSS